MCFPRFVIRNKLITLINIRKNNVQNFIKFIIIKKLLNIIETIKV